MEIIWSELTSGFPDTAQLVHVLIRLVAAIVLGAFIGWQREQAGKEAGLRTHILVSLGTALFVLAAAGSGMSSDGVSRVVQGLVTGIGFLGAGAILKLESERQIHGLTTAAGIWMTAAIGVAVGLGGLGLALIGTVMAWIVLAVLGRIDVNAEAKQNGKQDPENTKTGVENK